MPQPLNILIVEDNPADAELLLRELRRAGFEPDWKRVDREDEFLVALQAGPELVVSDYEMPQFNGLRALELLRESDREIPFILVSGTIGEDTAVAAMKHGAADYLLKDRLARLGTAVTHALAGSQLRRERKLAEEAFRSTHAQLRQLLEHSPAVLYAVRLAGGKILPYLVSENINRLLGFSVKEALSYEWWIAQVHPEDHERAVACIAETLANGASRMEYRMRDTAGIYHWVEDNKRVVRDAAGVPVELVGVWTDITDRKQADQKIREQLAELLRWQEVMIDREDRVQALKAEVNTQLRQQNLPPRYAPPANP